MAIKPIEILIRAKDEASAVFGSLQSKAAAVGAAIVGYFGISAFVGAVRGAADLEAALSEVAAVSGAGAKELATLRTAAEDAGAATKYTATEAAVALGNLARAGLSSNQAIAALKPTLQLAQAGSIDLGQAAEITTKTIAGFGLAATDAGRIADVLSKGANASNTSVRGLGEAMSYAAPLAKTVGLDLESTVAIMGKFADGGIDASRAGTALNSILSQFADPSSKFKAALSDAGITTRDFNSALVQLAAKGKDGEKAMLAVGTEAGPALRSLLNQGIPALNELRNSLKDASGSAEATAKIMGDNLKGSMDGLSSAWDAVKIKLTTPVLPVLKSGVDSLAASFTELVSSGVVTKFGQAISQGFESAITWAKAFLAQVDFAAMGDSMRSYADRVSQAFDDIKTAATNAGNVVQTVWGVMATGANFVMTAAAAVGAALVGMNAVAQSVVADVLAGLAKITFGSVSASFKAAAEEMKLSAFATWSAAGALADKSKDSFNAMADGAELARKGWNGLTADTGEAAQNTATAKRVIEDTAKTLKTMGDSAVDAGGKSSAATKELAEKAEAAREKVAALKIEYAAALRSGDWKAQVKSLEDLEHATNASTVAAKALGVAIGDVAADKVGKVKDAFLQMGIQTKDELTKAAAIAKDRFETIKSSGLATTEGLQTAFKKMAEAAIAANGGIATDTLRAQAEMYKLKITTDEFGRSVISAMEGGTKSTQQFGSAVQDATSKLEAQNAAVERQISAQEKANDLKQRAIDLENKRRGVDAQGFSTDAQGNRIVGSYDPVDAKARAATKKDMSGNFDPEEYAKQYAFFKGQQDAVLTDAAERGKASGGYGTASSGPIGGPAKTYNVTLGGTTIRTSSDDDAQKLMRLLNDAKRAS